MNRRGFLGSAALVATIPAWAAETRARVSVLASGTAEQFAARLALLRRNVRADLQLFAADGDLPSLPEIARRIVAAEPRVVVADSMISARALFEASATIPIVLARSENPVAARLVKSLEQPGGNVTGVVTGNVDEVLKGCEYLGRLLPPGAAFVAMLNQNNQTYRAVRARVNHVAKQQQRPQVFLDANRPSEIEAAMRAFAAEKSAGLLVMDDPMFLDEARRIVPLAAKTRRPVLYPDRAFVRAGGVASYGSDSEVATAAAAEYVQQILGGKKPAELALRTLPFKLVVNREAARAQGWKLPAGLG